MKKIVLGSSVVLLSIGLFSCLKSNDNDLGQQNCDYDSCSVKAPAAEIQAVQQYLTDSNLTATQHCSGLFYNVETEGTGTTPTPCSYVTVKYKGKLTNGTVFDSTKAGYTYSNYLGNLIRGWLNGVPYIKKGGKIHLYVPPTLGYGAQQAGSIPANSVLIFDVELVDVQ